MIKHNHDPRMTNSTKLGLDDAEDIAEYKKTGKKPSKAEEAREDKGK